MEGLRHRCSLPCGAAGPGTIPWHRAGLQLGARQAVPYEERWGALQGKIPLHSLKTLEIASGKSRTCLKAFINQNCKEFESFSRALCVLICFVTSGEEVQPQDAGSE